MCHNVCCSFYYAGAGPNYQQTDLDGLDRLQNALKSLAIFPDFLNINNTNTQAVILLLSVQCNAVNERLCPNNCLRLFKGI